RGPAGPRGPAPLKTVENRPSTADKKDGVPRLARGAVDRRLAGDAHEENPRGDRRDRCDRGGGGRNLVLHGFPLSRAGARAGPEPLSEREIQPRHGGPRSRLRTAPGRSRYAERQPRLAREPG